MRYMSHTHQHVSHIFCTLIIINFTYTHTELLSLEHCIARVLPDLPYAFREISEGGGMGKILGKIGGLEEIFPNAQKGRKSGVLRAEKGLKIEVFRKYAREARDFFEKYKIGISKALWA